MRTGRDVKEYRTGCSYKRGDSARMVYEESTGEERETGREVTRRGVGGWYWGSEEN